ncbi:hypothetical protein CPL00368_CDS0165 [Klebsiella phage DevonBitter]
MQRKLCYGAQIKLMCWNLYHALNGNRELTRIYSVK